MKFLLALILVCVTPAACASELAHGTWSDPVLLYSQDKNGEWSIRHSRVEHLGDTVGICYQAKGQTKVKCWYHMGGGEIDLLEVPLIDEPTT
jgi:hypothetical protein